MRAGQDIPMDPEPDDTEHPIEETVLDVTRVAAHLSEHGMRLDPDFEPRRLSGGLANINYLVSVDGIPVVLRRPPAGELPPGAHDMAREHKILSRLWQAFPLAPRSRHLCEDRSVIGVPFQLIDYRAGIVLRGDTVPAEQVAEDLGERLTNMLVGTLADFHKVDAKDVGLGEFGRPAGFLARGVAGWVKRADGLAEAGGVSPLVREVGDWLSDRIADVPDRVPTLLHNDFKLNNMILDPADLSPVAVIDWDMGSRGDPAFDLATLLSYWTEPGDPDCMHRMAQSPSGRYPFPDRAAVVDRYAGLTDFDRTGFTAVRVLCLFKLGIVFLQLHQRWREGALGDDSYAAFQPLGIELVEFSRDVARGRYF